MIIERIFKMPQKNTLPHKNALKKSLVLIGHLVYVLAIYLTSGGGFGAT